MRKVMALVAGVLCGVVLYSLPASAASIQNSKHNFAFTSNTDPSPWSGKFFVGSETAGNQITQICVFCHTPHGASTAPEYGATSQYLWNRVPSQRVGGVDQASDFKPYSSSSYTWGLANAPTGISLMCLSCHDGVTSIAVGSLLNAPGSRNPAIVGAASLGGYVSLGDIYYMDVTGPAPAGFLPNLGNLSGAFGAPYNSNQVDLSNDHPVSFPYSLVNGRPTEFHVPQPLNSGQLRLFGPTQTVECSTCHNVHDPAIPPFLSMSNNGSQMCTSCHIK